MMEFENNNQPSNQIKDELSQSSSQSIEIQQNISSESPQVKQKGKKKRIVRKKYKPRKKDIFIHTICIMNKNHFNLQNSIIQTFPLSNHQQLKQADHQQIKSSTSKKDIEFLKKFMDSIKFTQKLHHNHESKNVTTQNMHVNNQVSVAKNYQNQQITHNRMNMHEGMQYFPNLISTYLSMLNNARFY